MEEDIKLGDIVALKSGGPRMTIQSILEGGPKSGERQVWCKWFVKVDGASEVRDSFFSAASLKTAENEVA